MTDNPEITDGPEVADGREIADGLEISDGLDISDGLAIGDLPENPDGPETDGAEMSVDLEQPAMSRELTELLIQLSISVHRFSMYPPGHPSLEPAAEGVVDRFKRLRDDRESLAIGVAAGQLVIEGVATDAGHPVLSDLARRFHGHQIGAVSLDRAVSVSEVEALCLTMAADPERDTDPIGLLPRDEIPDWDHVHLYPLGYDRLELKDVGEGTEGVPVDRATELWLGLARSAMAGESVESRDEAPTPQAIARSLRSRRKEAAYDQVIMGHLLQLAEELKGGEGEAVQIREHVSDLIEALDDSTLERFVEMGGDFSQRRRFVLDASQGLAANAVMKVLQAAAANSQQTISHSMTRLLTKLAVHSEGGDVAIKAGVDDALQENVEELMADWQLTDPNPDAYTLVLDDMARAAPVLAGDFDEEEDEEATSGATRLVEMALEVGAFGPTVEKAISDLLEEGRARFLIDAANAASDSSTAARIKAHLANPEQLRRMLSAETVDATTIDSIIADMGELAMEPLLDALAGADSRERREVLLVALEAFGSKVWEGVLHRLQDARWWVTRSMLQVVQTLDEAHEDFDAAEFLRHPDRRVRREAFPLAIEAGLRDKTLANALADEDERMVRMGLLELGDSVPETLVPTIVNRIVLSDRSPEIRALGIRTAGTSQSPLVLETLLTMSTVGKTIFGRLRLAPKSMEFLAALATLARFWPSESRVVKVLRQARRSKDPEIRAAGEAP